MSLISYYVNPDAYRGFLVQYHVTEFHDKIIGVEAISFSGMRSFSSNAKTIEDARRLQFKKIDAMLEPIDPEYAI